MTLALAAAWQFKSPASGRPRCPCPRWKKLLGPTHRFDKCLVSGKRKGEAKGDNHASAPVAKRATARAAPRRLRSAVGTADEGARLPTLAGMMSPAIGRKGAKRKVSPRQLDSCRQRLCPVSALLVFYQDTKGFWVFTALSGLRVPSPALLAAEEVELSRPLPTMGDGLPDGPQK